jgi:hypothetical protein
MDSDQVSEQVQRLAVKNSHRNQKSCDPLLLLRVRLHLLRRCCRKGQYLGLVGALLDLKPGFSPVPTNGYVAWTEIFLRECQGGSHQRQRFRSG